MNKLLVMIAGLILITTGASWANKSHTEGKSITIQGEIIDLTCYVGHEGKGQKHKKCAEACLLEGSPLGLLTGQGQVYLLVEDHTKKELYQSLKKKAAETVLLTGKYFNKGGVQALIVNDLKK